MKQNSKSDKFRKRLYLSEFKLFDGEDFIKFNIVDINIDRNEVTTSVTYTGKRRIITYDLIREGDILHHLVIRMN